MAFYGTAWNCMFVFMAFVILFVVFVLSFDVFVFAFDTAVPKCANVI